MVIRLKSSRWCHVGREWIALGSRWVSKRQNTENGGMFLYLEAERSTKGRKMWLSSRVGVERRLFRVGGL